MRIVAVVGSGSGCGKTTVACRILGAVPGLGAIKISPRVCAPHVEWGPGAPGKDTERFSRSGAIKVARIVGPRGCAAGVWKAIQGEFSGCRGVLVEGVQGLSFSEDSLKIFVLGVEAEDRIQKNRDIASSCDVYFDNSHHFKAHNSHQLDITSHSGLFSSRDFRSKIVDFDGLQALIEELLISP